MAHVQQANTGASYQGGGTTSFTLAFGSVISSGNAIVINLSYDDSAAISSVVDDKGNTYTALDTIDDTSNGQKCTSLVLGNITNGPKTLTFNFNSAVSFGWAAADEYSAILAASNPVDQHSAKLMGVWLGIANSVTANPITTTVNGDTIWAAVNDTAANPGNVSWSGGTGFTIRNNQIVGAFFNNFGTEDAVQTTAGSITPSFSPNNPGVAAIVFAVALKPSGGAPPATIWIPQGDNNAAIVASSRAKTVAVALLAGAVWVPQIPTARSNTVLAGWYQPLSIAPPVAKVQLGSAFVPFNTGQLTPAPPSGWLAISSAAPPVVQAQSGFRFVPFNTPQFFPPPPWGWHQPLPATPRAVQAIQSQPNWAPAPFPTFTLAWQQPLAATPARYAAQQGILSLPFVIPIPTNTAIGMPWQQPLAIAVGSPAALQSNSFVPFNTVQAIITTTLIQRTLTGVGL